jgi:hypothetical protein
MAKVEIYTWRTCPFCIRAKALLDGKGAATRRSAWTAMSLVVMPWLPVAMGAAVFLRSSSTTPMWVVVMNCMVWSEPESSTPF